MKRVRFLFKALLGLAGIALALVLIACTLILLDIPYISPKMASTYIEQKTQFPTVINHLKVDLFGGHVLASDIKINNPSGYPEKGFLHITQFKARVNLPSLISDRLIVEELELGVSNVVISRNESSRFNVSHFIDNVYGNKIDVYAFDKPYLVKKLKVDLGSVTLGNFLDESFSENTITLNYSREFTDVTDLEVVFEAIAEDLKQFSTSLVSPKMVSSYIEQVFQFPTSVNRVEIDLLNGRALISDIRINNPSGYREKNFIHITQFKVDVHPPSFISDRLVIENLEVDANNVVLTKSNNNRFNAKHFIDNVRTREPNKPYLIKRLKITLGSFTLVNFPDKSFPRDNVPVNYSREFTNITDLGVVRNAVFEDLKQFGIDFFTSKIIMGILGTPVTVPAGVIQKTGEALGTGIKKLFNP